MDCRFSHWSICFEGTLDKAHSKQYKCNFLNLISIWRFREVNSIYVITLFIPASPSIMLRCPSVCQVSVAIAKILYKTACSSAKNRFKGRRTEIMCRQNVEIKWHWNMQKKNDFRVRRTYKTWLASYKSKCVLEWIIVLILDGNSGIGEHVRSNICYFWHLIRSRAVLNRFFFSGKTYFPCATYF